MKLAGQHWMRPEPIERTIARLAETGFDAVEFSAEPERYRPAPLRRLLDRHGIACWGAVSIMTRGRDLISAKAAVRRATLQYCRDTVDLVAALDGEVFTVVPAEVGRVAPRAAPETEWAWCVDGLRRLADHARRKKVRLAVEPLNRFETNFLNRHDQALALAAEVGGDVGVSLDVFHLNIEERNPLGAIRAAGSRLVDMHVADTNRRPPGQGHWDWKRFVRVLKEIGYRGCLTTEFVIPFDRSPRSATVQVDPGSVAPEFAADVQFIQDHGSVVLPDDRFTEAMRETARFLRALVR